MNIVKLMHISNDNGNHVYMVNQTSFQWEFNAGIYIH